MRIQLALGRVTGLVFVLLVTILALYNLLAAVGDYEESPVVEEAVEENVDHQVVVVREAGDTGLAYPGYTGKQRLTYGSVVFENMQNSHLSGLSVSQLIGAAGKGQAVTGNVFLLWCGYRRFFTFKHYVSLLSVIRFLQPDNLVMYAQEEPVMDAEGYNTWWEEVVESFPFFHVVKPPPGACERRMAFLKAQVKLHGGLALDEGIVVNARLRELLAVSGSLNGMNATGHNGYLYLAKAEADKKPAPPLAKGPLCVSPAEYGNLEGQVCVQPDGEYYPRDVWDAQGPFPELVRLLFYGTKDPIVPRYSESELIPNLGHIVWLGGGKMDYMFYLCCLSLLYVVEVDALYIHGDLPPTGPLWDRLKILPRVQHIYRENYHLVFSNSVKSASHMSDIWRGDIMMKYGGIYADTDVLFVKPFPTEIRSYDAVSTYAFRPSKFFPNTINLGVCMGKRNARYWHYFVQSLRWFQDKDWTWNGLRQPYKILEHHPDLLRVDPHLQVVCDQLLCHPTWADDYFNDKVNHITNETLLRDWQGSTHAYHFTWPSPLLDKSSTLKRKDMFAQMGQLILGKATVGMAKDLGISEKDVDV